ncbi:hypothetical protein AGABI2DRAFT_215356 [Agaricus bisporus var. bisporus H97]|nr:hypothetical protein AGABI2DRAFT_215356 [Agaricus bisporus var. bisporus H97]EKV51832.1 hypothetical protein AGABI2DRAFT_215356 [Agaricus bisporus var. bisporus H97]
MSCFFTSTLTPALVVFLLYLTYKLWRYKHVCLPPGPQPLPLIGNIHQIPLEHSHLTFARWGKQYGPITYISLFGKPVIILNTSQATLDLLEKRSVSYANRPRLIMAGEIVGYENAVTLAQYDSLHKERRKMIYEAFSSRKLSRYHEYEEQRVRKFAADLLRDPRNFLHHIAVYVAAVVFHATHGHEVLSHDDPFVHLAEKCGEDFAEMVRPGAFLVDVLPFLRYIPEWFPFTGFKQKAKLYRDTADRARDIPYDSVKKEWIDGMAKPSLTADILEAKPSRTPEEDFSYRWLTATIYAAGADTSNSNLSSFILAMALHPEVQRKASAELDRVVGPNRLPTFSDRHSLPYIRALCLETLRLYCPAPTALPHLAIKDDEYLGYHIPAGSTVIANTWAILHDPMNYPEPEKFIPERFMDTGLETAEFLDPRIFAFGYGRRVCPGRWFAEDMIFIVAATVLCLFEIGPASSGPPSGEFSPTLVIRPKPFECSIKPRSPEAEKLIKDIESM